VDDGEVTAFGRNGQVFKLHYLMVMSLRSAMSNGLWYIDGEVAKADDRHSYFFAFDMPVAGDLITPQTPFAQRLQALEHVAKLAQWDDHAPLGVLHYARTPQEKVDLVTRLKANHAEGVILRNLNGQYHEAIRSTDCLKFKFVLEADCVVSDIGAGGKNNIVLSVYRDGKLVEVGKCTALAGDASAIKKDDVVTVRYLYVSEDGRLVQPTYPLIRVDKSPEECLFNQLVPASREVLRWPAQSTT
jgi:ATP dependent DNA ligase domain